MDFKRITLFTLLACTMMFSACRKDNEDLPSELENQLDEALFNASNGVGKSYYSMPSSTDLASIPQDPKNPLTMAKVELGKFLYHETGLGVSPMMPDNEGQFSCASCHFASAGFQANRVQGIGEGGQGFGINGEGRTKDPSFEESMMDVQPLRTPSAMNAAYQKNLLWNGQFGATGVNVGTEANWTAGTPKATNHLGYEGLETQAIAGLAVHRMDVDELPGVIHTLGYKQMYDDAFPDFPQDERYTTETTGLAIAAFERTLLANQAPFQQYLKGQNDAMTDTEKRGALLFFGDAGCANCHNGPGLNNMEFHALGLKDLFDCPVPTFNTPEDDPANLGRGSFTGDPDDDFKFKVPQLYNLTDSPLLGHGSSKNSVREMVEYKNQAFAENPEVPLSKLSEDFVPLGLTNGQINDIVAFIENALHDPNLDRYVPESLPSGNCFPFSDPMARVDLGCE